MKRDIGLRHPDGRVVEDDSRVLMADETALWQGIPLEIRACSGAGELTACYAPFHFVGACLGGSGWSDVRAGASSYRVPFQQGAICLLDKGFEISGITWKGSAEQLVGIQLSTDTLHALMPDESSRLGFDSSFLLRDEILFDLLVAIRDEVERGCTSGRLFAQGLSMAVVGYLKSRHAQRCSIARAPGRLSTNEVARVTDYILENLCNDIGVEDLAALVSRSPSHFSRMFKATVSVSPYRFLQQRRVDRAIELLRLPIPLAQIAQSVGFSDQSRFNMVFRQLTGQSPGRLRAKLMS